MFFGEKLRLLRVKSKQGLRGFSKEIGVSLSFLNKIELGYKKLEDIDRYEGIKEKLKENNITKEDIDELDEFFTSPFVMQKMNENLFPSPFTHKIDGKMLSEDELKSLSNYIKEQAVIHNKKADVFNSKCKEK